MDQTQAPIENIFVPIDLEMSLGKIDEDETPSMPMQVEDSPVTRTCNHIPFGDSHVISPYPYSETVDEVRERRTLTETDPSWPLRAPPLTEEPMELIPVDDDFSLSSEEAGSLEEFEETMEDPVSFWESASEIMVAKEESPQPTLIPQSESYSSSCHPAPRGKTVSALRRSSL